MRGRPARFWGAGLVERGEGCCAWAASVPRSAALCTARSRKYTGDLMPFKNMQIYEGTNQIQRVVIARELLARQGGGAG